MKTYRVELESRAKKELLSLPHKIRNQLAGAIDDLGCNPRPPGAKKLIGPYGYRLRKGTYRLLYTIDDKKQLLRLYRIGHRREVYRNLGTRCVSPD